VHILVIPDVKLKQAAQQVFQAQLRKESLALMLKKKLWNSLTN
jgi:hypothetical protein